MAYALIYDIWDLLNGEWIDSSYEAFNSPEEAIKAFTDTFGLIPEDVQNPRVVLILEPVPGQWGPK